MLVLQIIVDFVIKIVTIYTFEEWKLLESTIKQVVKAFILRIKTREIIDVLE